MYQALFPLNCIWVFSEPCILPLYVSHRGIRVAVSKFRQPRSKVIKLNTVKVDLCDWLWAVKRSVQGLQRASTVEVQGGGTVVHKEHWE